VADEALDVENAAEESCQGGWRMQLSNMVADFVASNAAVWRWCRPLEASPRLFIPDSRLPYRLPPTAIVGIGSTAAEEPWGFWCCRRK